MSTNDILIAITTLILESGGEGVRGMQCVNEVIQTRAVERRLTVAQVCLARKQFSCFNSGRWEDAVRRARSHPKWEEARKIVMGPVTNWTKGATHYHTHAVSPAWSKGRTPVLVHRNHKFYRL